MAITLALLSSLLMSFTTIMMKKGIERTNPTSAMLVVTVVGSLIFLAISLPVIKLDYLKSKAFLLFILAGIFAPALVRWLYFVSPGTVLIITGIIILQRSMDTDGDF